MISIRKSLTELDRTAEEREMAFDCYRQAIRDAAQYAVELDEEVTEPYRSALVSLEKELVEGGGEALPQCRGNLRGLFRNYRDQAVTYLGRLRSDLSEAISSLQSTMDALTQADGSHDVKMQTAVKRLRQIPPTADMVSVRQAIRTTVTEIEAAQEQLHREHQLTIAQFVAEIRVLHRRIDSLESSVSVDQLTGLATRAEMEPRIYEGQAGTYCLVLIRAAGLRSVDTHLNRETAAELTGAFAKRLRNGLPSETAIGRWAEEAFVAMVPQSQAECMKLARWVGSNLTGPYACMFQGKLVHLSLKLGVAVIDSSDVSPQRMIERSLHFLDIAPE
jgi:GGDEF domain-containing protein